MALPRIVLTGLGPKLQGLEWETEQTIRIGRQNTADVVLRDVSVERLHAEVKNCGNRWVVRDLADNEFFPTLLNGEPLRGGQQDLHLGDMVQLGKVIIKVTDLEMAQPDSDEPAIVKLPGPTPVVPYSNPQAAVGAGDTVNAPSPQGRQVVSWTGIEVQAVARRSWNQALESAAGGARPFQGPTALALLRANQHLTSFFSLDHLLQSILEDALKALHAQRAVAFLVNSQTEHLEVRASFAPQLMQVDKGYSKTLVERSYRRGESILCQDTISDQALLEGQRVKLAGMTSVICAMLRTPQKRLGVLHLDRGPLQEPFTEQDLYLADAFAASVGVGIECARVVEEERGQFVDTVTTLARAVDARDQYSGDHTRRVTDFSLLLAEELALPHMERHQLQLGTPLYDIGKIGIDDAILRKPGKLTPAEHDVMKGHTIQGAVILESIASLKRVVPIVRHHHERWDGTGYPDGLGRDRIALTARIVAIADAFDAMTSDRPYRQAMPAQKAFLEILSKSGTHFDPACVQAFLRVRTKVEKVLNRDK